jgi:hypothetical protein
MLPHEDHGNPDYLTIEGLEKSAKIDGIALDEAVDRLTKTVEVGKNAMDCVVDGDFTARLSQKRIGE